MNFYKHHLGDYDGATSHLSWDEDMAYTRLLRVYYRREQPITDADKYRLCRATSKAQRAAVDRVLGEFFRQQGDGWHNKRADEEIAAYHETEEDRDAKRENEKERQRRHRGRRKELFAALKKHDIVPAFDTTTESLQAMLSRVTGGSGHGHVTHSVTRNATANQIPEPLTTNQNPDTRKEHQHQTSGISKTGGNGTNGNGVVVMIPLLKKREWAVPPDFLQELESAYPAVDGPATLREIRAWCIANPDRCKPEGEVRRFINSWFERTQNA